MNWVPQSPCVYELLLHIEPEQLTFGHCRWIRCTGPVFWNIWLQSRDAHRLYLSQCQAHGRHSMDGLVLQHVVAWDKEHHSATIDDKGNRLTTSLRDFLLSVYINMHVKPNMTFSHARFHASASVTVLLKQCQWILCFCRSWSRISHKASLKALSGSSFLSKLRE